MKRIFLLSGSRAGSHYICTLFNTAFSTAHLPELLNKSHWPNKKDYVSRYCKKNKITNNFNKENVFKILSNEQYFITKYYLGYDMTPKDILNFALDNNVEFYFLYRKNNIDTIISLLYMHHGGKPTKERITKAIELANYNNGLLKNTYEYFKDYIKSVIVYEDLTFTIKDLELFKLPLPESCVNVSITPKIVSPLDREKIYNKVTQYYQYESEFVL